jgi:hypothetical protein
MQCKEERMNTGMLWHDDTADTLETKVSRAARYYARKYGATPNACQVHTAMLEAERVVDGVRVTPAHDVLQNHLWIGVDERA